MKKPIALLLAGVVGFIYACGPSAKEKEEKRIQDSIRVADSITLVQGEQRRIADSITKAQEAKKMADSIAHQDSIKKRLFKPKKAEMMKPETKKKEAKKKK
ncbi:MAG: hypothetical protein NTX61_09475 [Bacteroidetes bacterium]|nr:hypothetical protein [Bacteroidota bacterium]